MPSTPEATFTTYAESPLASLLITALKRITELKKKYPPGPSDRHDKEAHKAHIQVDTTQTMLHTVHQIILPLFNKGQAPDLFDLMRNIPAFLELRNLKGKINALENILLQSINEPLTNLVTTAKTTPNESLTDAVIAGLTQSKTSIIQSTPKKHHKDMSALFDQFTDQIKFLDLEAHRADLPETLAQYIMQHLTLELLTPRHPMTYELMNILDELISNAPKTIMDAMPFFNPDVIADLTSTIGISGALKDEAQILKIIQCPTNETESLSYSFEITKIKKSNDKKKPKDVYTEIRHLADEYIAKRFYLLNELVAPTTRRYLAKHGLQHAKDYPHAATVIEQGFKRIQSDMARSEVLQTLAHNECQSISTSVSALIQRSIAFFATHETPSITALEELLQSHETLTDLLTEKKAMYPVTPVRRLLQSDENQAILTSFLAHQLEGLDVNYSDNPLPDVDLCATSGMQSLGSAINPIGVKLHSTIDSSLEPLQRNIKHIRENIEALQADSETAIFDTLYAKALGLVNLDEMQQRLKQANNDLPLLKKQRLLYLEQFNTTQRQCSSLQTEFTIDAEVLRRKKELNELSAQCKEHQDAMDGVLASLTSIADQKASLQKTPQQERILGWLPLITDILQEDLKTIEEKPKISFKTIDELIQPGILSTDAHVGFFSLIQAIAPDIESSCRRYCKQQDDFWKMNPSRSEFESMIGSLLDHITSASQALQELLKTNNIKNDALDNGVRTLQERLKCFHEQLEPLDRQKSTLEKELSIFSEHLNTLTQLERTADEEKDLTAHQHVLTELTEIISSIGSLKINVHGNERTIEHVAMLKHAQNLIIQRINQVSLVVAGLQDPTFYQTNLLAIEQLFSPIKLRIDTVALTAQQHQDQIDMVLKKAQRQALASKLSAQLDDYRKTRHSKYSVKDFFSSKDKVKRNAFVSTLRHQLLHYSDSGNADVLLQTIRDNIVHFPGRHLKPLLHGITISIIDIQDKPFSKERGLAQHATAKEHLTKLNKTHPNYVKTMVKLYEKIEFMTHYGATLTKKKDKSGEDVTELAKKLREDTDHFINGHDIKLPTIEKYTEFKEKFMARLHSKDNIMNAHRHKWFSIVGNIALLILLIPKLIYSKVITGQCSFFFETTKKTALIDAIDKQACQLAPTIAR